MDHQHIETMDVAVHCTVTPSTLKLIDHYAERSEHFRSNWLRSAIIEKLEREILAETGRPAHNRKAA